MVIVVVIIRIIIVPSDFFPRMTQDGRPNVSVKKPYEGEHGRLDDSNPHGHSETFAKSAAKRIVAFHLSHQNTHHAVGSFAEDGEEADNSRDLHCLSLGSQGLVEAAAGPKEIQEPRKRRQDEDTEGRRHEAENLAREEVGVIHLVHARVWQA